MKILVPATLFLALAACSGNNAPRDTETAATTNGIDPAAPPPVATESVGNDALAANGAAPAGAPAPDDVATLSGAQFASFTGDASKGKTAFTVCATCHAVDPGANRIGPTLHQVVGRKAGTVPGYNYSAANKNSGITWTKEKLFQYLEKPQRVVPGTKMTYPGMADPQQRADLIAYLATV